MSNPCYNPYYVVLYYIIILSRHHLLSRVHLERITLFLYMYHLSPLLMKSNRSRHMSLLLYQASPQLAGMIKIELLRPSSYKLL